MMTADFLKDKGFEVTEASDGDEAAKLLDKASSLDVLFTDMQMPGTVDGIDLAVRARRRYPAPPLLIVSGYAAQLTARLGAFEPAAAFLAKPYKLMKAADMLKLLSLKM